MVTILVTGGEGFIGKNLTEYLRGQGHEVWKCDIKHSDDPQFVRCDVGEYRQLEAVFEERHFDYIYHAAAEYGRWNGEAHYENLWRTNVVGTKNVLKVQKRFKSRMIFFGSAEVNGDYEGVMSEDVMDRLPIKQMNDYAIGKWANELQVINSAKMDNTETVRVRLFNVYGPHEYYSPFRGVVPVFIYRALHDLPYAVHRGHKRTFEYVSDICRTLGRTIEHFKPGEVYNLGSEKQYTIEELSALVLKHTARDGSKVKIQSEEAFTTKAKVADSSKAKRDLDHRIVVNLDEGIGRTVDWFKKAYRVGE